MKKFLNKLYVYPVLFSILINCISTVIVIVAINKDNYYLLTTFILTLILNKKITENGVELNKMNQVVVFMSYFGMITASFLCNKYINFSNLI